MDESVEGHSVTPAGGEVVDIDIWISVQNTDMVQLMYIIMP